MKKISLFATMAAAITICSCSLEKLESAQSDGSLIQVSASVSAFNTKADASGFESGDSFGLFALDPINAVNIRYTLGSNGFTSSSALTWGAGQTTPTTFIAYYPYLQDITMDGSVSIKVEADQTSHSAYTASDYMLATAQASPGEKVKLNFKHVMSRLVFEVSGIQDEVVSLSLEGVRTSASADLAKMAVSVSGAPGSIKAAPVTLDGKKAWELIAVPQTCLPAVKLVTASGKEYSIPASDSLRFISGRETGAKVRISENMGVASFTATITPWAAGSGMGYEPTTGETWHSIGTARYIDDNICNLVEDAKHYEWDVEIQENVLLQGYYRLVNPFKDWKYLSGNVTYDSSKDNYIYINATDPDRVHIEESSTGIILNGEDFLIGSLCSENGFGGYEEYGTMDSHYCISFPSDGLFNFHDGGYFYSNVRGMTYITLPTGTRTQVLLDIVDGNCYGYAEGNEHRFEFKTSMETKGIWFKVFEDGVEDGLANKLVDQMLETGKLDWEYYPTSEPEDVISITKTLEPGKFYSGYAFTFDYGPLGTWWYSWYYVNVSL